MKIVRIGGVQVRWLAVGWMSEVIVQDDVNVKTQKRIRNDSREMRRKWSEDELNWG
jgi:hypothetical protein